MPRSIFPQFSLEETLVIARAIWEHNGGKPIGRLVLFDSIQRQPDSGTSRSLLTASVGYGLTQGGYSAKTISLTERGTAIVSRNDSLSKVSAALEPEVFKAFFEHYENLAIPTKAAAIDFLKKQEIPDNSAEKCFEILLQTGRQVRLVQEVTGKERIFAADSVVEHLRGAGMNSESERQKTGEDDSMPPSEKSEKIVIPPYTPDLHIDIQIHISSDATPEQIEQIFASMAKHLYGRS